jgi:hypothetical protein
MKNKSNNFRRSSLKNSRVSLTVLPIRKKNSVAQFQFIRTGILQIDKTAAFVAIFYKYQLLVDALDPACTHTY